MIGRCDGIFIHSFFIFCLEATEEKNTWMRTISVKVIVSISKRVFWKLLDFSYVQSSFSTITRHTDKGIWKILCSWRFNGHGSTYMLFLSWVNITKWKWVKVPWKLSFAQKIETVRWGKLHQDISLIIVFLFASQTSLVFNFSLALIE